MSMAIVCMVKSNRVDNNDTMTEEESTDEEVTYLVKSSMHRGLGDYLFSVHEIRDTSYLRRLKFSGDAAQCGHSRAWFSGHTIRPPESLTLCPWFDYGFIPSDLFRDPLNGRGVEAACNKHSHKFYAFRREKE